MQATVHERHAKSALAKRAVAYIETLSPSIFDEKGKLKVTNIKEIGTGTRHFNYLVTMNGRKFLLRLSLTAEQEEHIRYEYEALQALQGTGTVPRVYYHEGTSEHMGRPFLIMEYVEGVHPSDFSVENVMQIAAAVARLHRTKLTDNIIKKLKHRVSKDEILSIIKERVDYLAEKNLELSGNPKLTQMLESTFETLEALDVRECSIGVLSHGDIASTNTVLTGPALKFIDWETIAITDPAYDIISLFDRSGFDRQQRETFMEGYLAIRPDRGLSSRMPAFEKLREFDRLCWYIWEALDVAEGAKDPLYPKWGTAELYASHARQRFAECKKLGIIPDSFSWKGLGVEELLARAVEKSRETHAVRRAYPYTKI